MKRIRHPAAAGTFYPADADVLATMIDGLLADVPYVDDPVPPRALIAPHAGYRYSGVTAATVYARLRPWVDQFTTVVVVGPAHRVPLDGVGLSSADEFTTPLGEVPVARHEYDLLLTHPAVTVNNTTHQLEHSVEVQLPFLQRVLGTGWQLVPVVAGDVAAADFADAFDALWDRPDVLFVISSDLSHYHPLTVARRLDLITAANIVSGDWEHIQRGDACGITPLCGALELARRHDQHAFAIKLTTSVDGGGPAESVVGYGSFVLR